MPIIILASLSLFSISDERNLSLWKHFGCVAWTFCSSREMLCMLLSLKAEGAWLQLSHEAGDPPSASPPLLCLPCLAFINTLLSVLKNFWRIIWPLILLIPLLIFIKTANQIPLFYGASLPSPSPPLPFPSFPLPSHFCVCMYVHINVYGVSTCACMWKPEGSFSCHSSNATHLLGWSSPSRLD